MRLVSASRSRGITSGISDDDAGEFTLVIAPIASRIAKYTGTGASNADAIASATPTPPVSSAHTVVRNRRSLRSTNTPDGTNSTSTGSTWTRPTNAIVRLSPVRA